MIEIEYSKIVSALIEKNVEKVAKGIWDFGADIYSKGKAKDRESFNLYFDKAISKYSKVKNILYRNEPVYIYDIYVDVTLDYKNKDTSSIKSLLNIDEKDSSEERGSDIQTHFLVISGSAGNGKSTLMKHLFINCLEQEDLIPILIELRNINKKDISFDDLVYESIKSFGFPYSKDVLLKSFETGKIVFLFDGFDEITPSLRSEVAKSISSLSDKYNKNYYLVSSRPDEYIQYLDKYDVAHMQHLSLEQSSELVKKTKYEDKIKSQFLNELSTSLYRDYRDFASSPLLLLIMLMTYEENADIPSKRTDFYSEAFSTLYKKHDATKSGYKRILYSGLQYESFKAVINVFSAISYFNDNITFTEDDIFQNLDSSKKSTDLEFDSEKYLLDLTQSVCVLAQDGLYYTYTHKTFQEYFVAKFLIGTEASVRRRIFEKKVPFNRLEANILIELLYEIDSSLTEVDLLIPTLKNLKKLTRYEETERRKSYLHLSEILHRRKLMGSSESFIAYSEYISKMCGIDQDTVNKSLYEIDLFLEKNKETAPELNREFLKAYESLMASLSRLEQKHKNVERSIEEMLNI